MHRNVTPDKAEGSIVTTWMNPENMKLYETTPDPKDYT